MITIFKWCASFWLICLLVVTNTACKDKVPPSSYKLQHQVSKIIESRYHSDLQYAGRSTKPPILYQGKIYYYVVGRVRTYRYDIQGRIIFNGYVDADYPNDSYSKEYNSYTYVNDRIIRYYSNSGVYDTLTFNSRGYAIANVYYRNNTYEYDKDNYLVRKVAPYYSSSPASKQLTTRIIIDGNISKEVIENDLQTTTTEQKYDLTHNALPDPLALFNEGKGSLNLFLQTVTLTKRPEPLTTYGITDPYTVSSSYTYEFDDLNRVTKQNIFETTTNLNTNKISTILTVKQFTYSD